MNTRIGKTIVLAGLLTCLATASAAPSADEAGVRDTENRWSQAFVGGDTAALDALLDAGYVSTNAAGKARSKADILRVSADYAKAHPDERATPLAATSTIQVMGNAALVRHHSGNDTSVDVFYFKDGHWTAWYSQHTKVSE